MRRPALLALLLALTLAPSARADDRAAQLPIGDPARRDRKVAVVLDAITDAARGDTIGPAELAARLDGVRLVFVGESHVDLEFHRAQLQVIRELRARGRTVLVGLEMYPVPEQRWLDRWCRDRRMSEERFLAESHWYGNWGYHWDYYRDIFLFAREHGVRLFAVNLPRAAVTTVRTKGFDSLATDVRAMLPPKVDVSDPEHQRLFRAFFGDEDALHGNLPDSVFQGMFRAQCAWDAGMAWNAVKALRENRDTSAIMVVMIGAGHVAYGLGAERQARGWFDGRMATVLPIPLTESADAAPLTQVQASYADFVWGLPAFTDPLFPASGFSLAETPRDGRYRVIMVAKDSPAADAGFRMGDELVSIDGLAITTKEVLHRQMSTKRWGDHAAFRVLRKGAPLDLTVQLRRRVEEATPSPGTGTPPPR
jgi:uncharacterized iron-regulated protein